MVSTGADRTVRAFFAAYYADNNGDTWYPAYRYRIPKAAGATVTRMMTKI